MAAAPAAAVAPARDYRSTPAKLKLKHEAISLVTRDSVRLDGWWLPGGDTAAVIVLAGSGVGNQGDLLPRARELVKRGFTVMTFDYRGFGPRGVGATDSLRRLLYSSAYVEDAAAALRWARRRLGPQGRVFAYGSDLGSAASLAAAVRTGAADAVVADGLWSMTREYLLRAGLSQDYRAVEYAHRQVLFEDEPAVASVQLRVPLLLVVCERDTLMPKLEAQAAVRGVRSRLDIWNVPGARHGESVARLPDYFDRLARWFRMLQGFPRAG